jgi:hypothetical protein
MSFATNERLDKALRLLTQGLGPYVEAKMKARHGNSWLVQASRAGGAIRAHPSMLMRCSRQCSTTGRLFSAMT